MTFCTPCRRATKLRQTPTRCVVYQKTGGATRSFFEFLQYGFQLGANIGKWRCRGHDSRRCRPLGQLCPSPGYGETHIVEQVPDTARRMNIVRSVIAPVTAAFDRRERGELLLPVTQDMRFYTAKRAGFTDREVPLVGYCRKRIGLSR